MPLYSVYGLVLDSEIPFPELPTAPAAAAGISLRLGPVPIGESPLERVAYTPLSPREVFVRYRNVGAALVRFGTDITLQPHPAVDPLTLRLFVLQQVTGVALLQRGLFVLHASAAVVNGHAVAFSGVSGQGKSTMLAALNQLGCPILTDDVLAVDLRDPASPTALPGLVQLKLTDETRSRVASEILSAQPIGGRLTKKLCAIRGDSAAHSAPLAEVYLLGNADRLQFTPLPPALAAMELVRNTYGSRLLHSIGLSASHFQQCIHLAQRLPVTVLARPRDLSLLQEIAAAVIDRVRQPPLL